MVATADSPVDGKERGTTGEDCGEGVADFRHRNGRGNGGKLRRNPARIFWLDLSFAYGIPVKLLQKMIDSHEFTELLAYDKIRGVPRPEDALKERPPIMRDGSELFTDLQAKATRNHA